MKSLKRRLLSLFLAMVMVLSLAPGALAENPEVPSGAQWNGGSSLDSNHQHTAQNYSEKQATCKEDGLKTWTCCCGATTTEKIDKSTTHTAGTEYITENGKHYPKCKVCDGKASETGTDCAAGTSPTFQKTSDGKHKAVCGTCGTVFGSEINCDVASASWQSDATNHWKVCTANVCDAQINKAVHDWTNGACVCGKAQSTTPSTVGSVGLSSNNITKNPGEQATITVTVKDSSGAAMSGQTVEITRKSGDSATAGTAAATNAQGSTTFEVTAFDIKAGSNTFEVKAGDKTATLTFKVNSPVTISATPSDAHIDEIDGYVRLNANYSGSNSTIYSWAFSGAKNYFSWSDDDKAEINIYADSISSSNRTLTATVTVRDGDKTFTASKNVTLEIDAQISVSATVSDNYYLGDGDNKTNDSIWDKIEDRVYKINSKYELKSVEFETYASRYGDLDGVTSKNKNFDEDELDEIEFIPEEKGDAEFRFTAHVFDTSARKDRELSGMLTITVTDTSSSSSGDITYMAELGEDVYFEVSDFEDYFDDKFSSGSLDYVIFESASNGKVKDGRSVVDYENDKYYVDPGKNQDDLADVYFAPNSSKKAMTGTVKFTVYGTKSSQKRAGTITIYYLNDNASDITYNTVNGKVTLDPKDFEAAYKEATGSKTAPSNLVIEFQNVPTNGTLTYTGGSRDKDLTKSTVKGTRYTTKSSGTNRLAQLTYSGTKGKDTIDYIAYSGGTAQFSGRVVFNGTAAVPQDVVVYYASTAGQPARFSQNDFTTANSAMSKAAKIRFVTPANGTLYLNGSTSAAGIDIAPALLYSVTYQPKAGFNGTDKVVFAAYDASNNLVANGSVNITVAGNPTTSTTPGGTTNPGGVTDVSQFTDVSGNAWYRANLATLVSKGVISGRGDGKFDPKGTVTYGEALKMVLESCGYTAAVGTGSQWAINYKNLAVSKGWISSSIDLNAAISRNATAELAAKVLGVAPVTSGSPFGDEANAYAVALYYTTPQIFVGTTNPNGGKPLFENSKPLLREQVCAVICRVSDYHTQHTTNVMPDGV